MTRDTDSTESGDADESSDGSDSGRLSGSRRDVLSGVTAGTLATGLGLVGTSGTALGSGGDDGNDDDDDDDDDDYGSVGDSPSATVEFRNQETDGETVVVAETCLSGDGYVAIHDARLFEGKAVESVVGVSEYLDAGPHEDIEVELFDVAGADFDDDELEKSQPLVAMPHRETEDDETYEFVETDGEEDGPFVRAGQPVVDLAFAVVD